MTDEYIPRGENPLPLELLMPESAKQKDMVGRIQKLLQKSGSDPLDAYNLALRIWRITRQ